MDPMSGEIMLATATRSVADGNARALVRHGNVAKRMAIDVTVVRDLTALRAIEAEWRLLAGAGAGSGAGGASEGAAAGAASFLAHPLSPANGRSTAVPPINFNTARRLFLDSKSSLMNDYSLVNVDRDAADGAAP